MSDDDLVALLSIKNVDLTRIFMNINEIPESWIISKGGLMTLAQLDN